MDVSIYKQWEADEAVQRLREYLRIPSVHPDVDYDECVDFIKKQASLLELSVTVHEIVPKKPTVVLKWEGKRPELPAILLNSHMDVVPVYEECWTYPPFAAELTKDGWIYARGTQDMKSIGMMYMETVRVLKKKGLRLERTVYISFSSDEEIGEDSMQAFTQTEEFKKLNIGFAMDESIPSQEPGVILGFNGERIARQLKVISKGVPGHGSLLPSDTAGEKLHYVIGNFLKFRDQERKKVEEGAWIGDVTTINLTQLEGGVQVNVLPESLTAYFDIRIPPQVDHDKFEQMVESWCKEAGDGVTIEYFFKEPAVGVTSINDSMPFWKVFNDALTDIGVKVKFSICPGVTDARFVRAQGIPAYNLSPLMATPLLLHAHDERIHVDTFKRGVEIMTSVVQAVGNHVF